MNLNINIDSEFKGLIPPLTSDERQGLEKSLLAEGCRDALVLWGDTLIDGHNRFEICTRNNIPFKTVQKEFADRRSAIEWIILNQFGRRNLPAHERARLALRLKPVIAEKAKEKQVEAGGALRQKSDKAEIDTKRELAKIANVSHDTIAKVEKIEKSAPEPIIEASRKGEISVNAAYQVTKLEPEQQEEIVQRIEQGEKTKDVVQEVQKRPHVSFNSGNNEWYTPKEIIDAARLTMGHIDLDPASNEIAQKIVNAETYYTAETNGLDKTWNGNVWLNPPYASDLIGKFADKLVAERANYRQAVVLVNNATETEWFRKIVSVSAAVCFPKGRVKFYMPDGRTGAPQIIDFSGIRYQQITPTDIDGMIEYHDIAFLIYEYKLEGAKMPYGQELALTRLVDGLQKSGKMAALLLCEHDVRDPNDDINGADAKVIKIYYCKNWYSDMKRRTVKEVTNSFIEFVNKQTPF